MNRYNSYKNTPDEARGSVCIIGNFDGVHAGHVQLIARGRQIADAAGKALSVLTFEPHPRQLFRPDETHSRLTPAPLKQERLSAAGVNTLFSIDFNWDLASLSADAFIDVILKEGLGVSHVLVGEDFRFGQMRSGSPDTIKGAGIDVTISDFFTETHGEKISSSDIRQLLRHGKIVEANALLGWEWEIRGVVTKGKQRGRDFGYPTANFGLGDVVHPAYGVYAGLVQIEGEADWRKAAVNIGIKPMFEVPEAEVEIHILDFSGDLYGKTLRLQPIQFLRSEAKFETLDDLIAQMERDCEQVREILEAR